MFELEGEPPILSVFGGKITTYRKLAEHAVQKLQPFFPQMKGDWTAMATLPGGDLPDADFDQYLACFKSSHPWLPADVAHHYCRLYGNKAEVLLGNARSIADLGQHFGAQLYAAEIDYLRQHEWAVTAEDILQRRTKLGLHLNATQRQAVNDYLSPA